MKNMRQVIDAAADHLNPRAGYARDVLRGWQRWSGADLQGKAKSFGSKYAQQRVKAAEALRMAGGVLVPVEHGLIVTAVYVGADDFGGAVYHTTVGVAVTARKWCRVVRDSIM